MLVHGTGTWQGRPACRDLDLAEETFRSERGGKLRSQHLDGHSAVVLDLAGEVHHCHPAATEFAVEFVLIGQGRHHPMKGT